jgi:hypothetical protein
MGTAEEATNIGNIKKSVVTQRIDSPIHSFTEEASSLCISKIGSIRP